jgi:AraC family transcriptional regulator
MSHSNLKRIYNTRNYIEINYNQIISTDTLEAVSCYSYRNLQRVFHSLFNETIGSFQTRLKLENGYKKILYSNKQISDIALEVGFADVQSFSKTFKKHFNFPPSVARSQKEILLNDTNPQQTIACLLKPEILFKPEIMVYYSSCKTSYVNPEIEQLWDLFLKNALTETDSAYFGVIADDIVITEKSKCTYDACITTCISTKNAPTKSIFGGKYARFTHYGSYSNLEVTYQQIFGSWLLDNEFECSHTPVIEEYIKNDANCDCEDDYLTAIYIPLL